MRFVTGAVPTGWAHPELVVDLGFTGAGPGFKAEGTVYAPDGRSGGLEPRRRAVPLAGPGYRGAHCCDWVGAGDTATRVEPFVEAAADPDMTGGWAWAPTPLGELATRATIRSTASARSSSPSWTSMCGR